MSAGSTSARPPIEWHQRGDADELAAALAAAVGGDLEAALGARGEASLVVSGGSTPRPFFERLRDLELDWRQVTVTLADERWVEASDEASNERMVRELLLRGRAAAARFVGLKTPHATPEEGESSCGERLAALPRPFDAVVLGMGGDGHTASLFPGAPGAERGLDPECEAACVAVRPEGLPPRISLSLPALLDARRLYLHVTGEAKRAVLERALGPASELPIGVVLRAAPRALPGSVGVWWSP